MWQGRLAWLDATMRAQRDFIHRVPDTRERAEHDLLRLIEMRDEAAGRCRQPEVSREAA